MVYEVTNDMGQINYRPCIWQGVQIMKLCIMQFSVATCYVFPYRSKYIPKHPFLRNLQSEFFL